MTDRPYQAHSEAELLELRRSLQGSIGTAEREKNDCMRQNAGVAFWKSEGFKEIEDKIGRLWSEDSAIQAELTRRRNERSR
jgi:hypothetical protein